ncbi:unnamed protein product [Polarella glacialis]|uniref:NADP-dependent oxidoreductase domain-containing protein n=1 Tax=Polarella glacialis TaxID=89957 RepID=A0A813LXF2_POLGL|nr:unnamed protein product [Polarella glacialis]
MMLWRTCLFIFLALPTTAASDGADSNETCPAGGCSDERPDGRPEFQVPRVIVGCWQLLERHRSPETAVETLLAYAQAGFTAFDTADIYGSSEEMILRVFQIIVCFDLLFVVLLFLLLLLLLLLLMLILLLFCGCLL